MVVPSALHALFSAPAVTCIPSLLAPSRRTCPHRLHRPASCLPHAHQVYLGAPNARDFAPGNRSFINALDFATPAALASFLLRLADNESLYNTYTEWRQQLAVSQSFACAVESDLTLMDEASLLCRACRAGAQQARHRCPGTRFMA